jgi:hypothetical protein
VATERRRTRVIAAAFASVAGVVLFVVVGGVGLAQSAVALAQHQSGDPGQHQDDRKIVICHKDTNTITISVNAWPAHQRHGDTEGECAAAATTQTKTKKPKKSTQAAAAAAATTAGTTKKPKKPKKQTTTSASSSSTPPHGKHKGKPAVGPKKPKKEKGQHQHVPAPPVAPTGAESTGPGNGNGNGHGNGNGKGKNK